MSMDRRRRADARCKLSYAPRAFTLPGAKALWIRQAGKHPFKGITVILVQIGRFVNYNSAKKPFGLHFGAVFASNRINFLQKMHISYSIQLKMHFEILRVAKFGLSLLTFQHRWAIMVTLPPERMATT